MDITLSDGNGYEICEYIKNKEDVPVIFLTAKDDDELNVVQGLDMGADDYIIKPSQKYKEQINLAIANIVGEVVQKFENRRKSSNG